MKKLTLGFAVAVLAFGVSTVFAANTNLSNGGLGQRAGDNANFGVAVCNNAAADLTASVPVVITANGVSVTVQSPASIGANTCAYIYVPYNSFNMIGGTSYTVNVVIDGGNSASYTATMPGSVLGASTTGASQARINLMALEIQLLNTVISKLELLLGISH
jgi:hypothetical protein